MNPGAQVLRQPTVRKEQQQKKVCIKKREHEEVVAAAQPVLQLSAWLRRCRVD
jgi:hypothetical protein